VKEVGYINFTKQLLCKNGDNQEDRS